MNDKEKANRVVALGVGSHAGWIGGYYMSWDASECDAGLDTHDAESFVEDRRVAGALMEKVDYFECKPCPSGKWMVRVSTESMMGVKEAFNKSLPRAIIDACVDALD